MGRTSVAVKNTIRHSRKLFQAIGGIIVS